MRLGDLDSLARRIRIECNPYGKPTIDFESGKKVLKIIDNAPTIEERPKGKWLPKGRWHIDPQCIEYTCSICGRRIMIEERLNVIEQYPFCHCGADMRGEKWTDTSES